MACKTCKQPIDGVCKEFINSDCIYISEELEYIGVSSETILTTALKRIDYVIGQINQGANKVLNLINIGNGSKIYSGVNNLGEHQLRSLVSSDGTVDIEESGDTIDFKVSVEAPEIQQASTTQAGIIEIATQTEVNTGTDDERAVTPLTLNNFFDNNQSEYALQVDGNSINLLKDGTIESTQSLPTFEDTYVTAFELQGTTLTIILNNGTNYSIDIEGLLDFEQVQADYTMNNSSSPAFIKNKNPNKTVFNNYTLTATDNNYVIVIDSTSPVTITVPNSLPNNFFIGFIQKSTGLVTIANMDVIPEGMTNTIRGRGHQAAVEIIDGTKFLFGNLNKSI